MGPVTHTCHGHDCSRSVPPRLFACRACWRKVPEPWRRALYREYRRGQEVDKRPSLRYLAVQRMCVAYTAFKPHDEAAALVTANYVAEAITLACKAIAAGLGDPLA